MSATSTSSKVVTTSVPPFVSTEDTLRPPSSCTYSNNGGHEADVDNDDEVQRLLTHLKQPPAPPADVPVYALPDQEYLESTVLPLLLRGMEEVAKARPPDPLAFLGAYLLTNNPQRGAVPLLDNENGRKVPLMELAMRAALHFQPENMAGEEEAKPPSL